MTPALQLQLLGTFAALMDGEPVTQFRSDKIRALLIYLAVESNRAHHREYLASLLWPQMARGDGLRNVRKSLSRLRRALGPAAGDRLLETTRQTIGIRQTEIAVDVLDFDRLLRETTQHEHTDVSACPACQQRLETAVQLYKGELLTGFMPGDTIPFSDWLFLEREKRHQQYVIALQNLAEAYIAREKWEQAAQHAQQMAAVEPWREVAHRQLMQIFAALGQTEAVRRQYEICRRQLQQELGSKPSPQTEALYRDLLHPRPTPTAAPPSAAPRSGLPRQFTSFVGRETALAEIGSRLDNPNCALLTLLGPGGIGKTRVSIETARQRGDRYRNGTLFVPLADITDPADIADAILETIDLPRSGKEESRELLLNYLREKELLLILDNFEQLLEGADLILEILGQAHHVQVLVTSRVALNLRAEWLYELDGLRTPSSAAAHDGASYAAVRLFLDRLAQLDTATDQPPAEIAGIARICRLVGGMPLAIELAASQARHRGAAQVAAQLAQSLDALQTEMIDVPARHRSLRVVFDHSWQALTSQEQDALMQMAIFSGDFTTAAATAVTGAGAELLAVLQEKSFLQPTGVDRYDLHAVLRQYAREKLAAAGRETAVRQHHRRYYLQELQRQERAMLGYQGKTVMSALQRDLANILQAWHTACAETAVEDLQNSHSAMAQFLYLRGLPAQGERAFAAAVAAITAVQPSPPTASPAHRLQAGLLNGHARFLFDTGNHDASHARAAEAQRIARAAGDPLEEARTLQQMSNIYLDQSDYQTALALCDQTEAILSGLPTLSDRQTWKLQIVQSTNHKLRCNAYQAVGDFEQARIALEQAMALDRANEDLRGEASCFLRRGIIARIQGKLDLAISAFERSMTLAKLTGYSRLQYLLKNSMALTYSDKGDNKTAQLFLEAYYDTAWEAGDLKSQLTGLINLGLTCARQGAYIAARDYDEKGLALARQLRNRWSEGLLLGNLGVVMMRIGDLSAADGLFTESLAARLEINDLPGEMYSRVYLARLALLTEEMETAVSQSRRVLDICQETPVRDVDHLARTTLGHVLLRQGDLAGARRRYREAVAGWDRSGREHLLLSPLSGLARIALIEDDVEQALNYCERILRQAPERDLESTFEPFDIWLICLQVLFAAADERAVTTLRAVVDELRERAAQFAIPAQQEQFLQHNPAHREILRLAGEHGLSSA